VAYLNPALSQFRAEVNAEYPGRDKGSDGTIGNEAHQVTNSDHNPDVDGSIDAWDMDVEVNGPGRPFLDDVERLKKVFQAHPSSGYWIHNDQIASRDGSWVRRSYAYAGPNRNRHDKHVHWNTRPAFENSTVPWEIDKPMTITELHALLRSILSADTATERQVRDMILGGVHSPASGRGLLSDISTRLEVLEQAHAATPSGGLSGDQIRAVVREEIDKTKLTS
jgi:hypothetical protein